MFSQQFHSRAYFIEKDSIECRTSNDEFKSQRIRILSKQRASNRFNVVGNTRAVVEAVPSDSIILMHIQLINGDGNAITQKGCRPLSSPGEPFSECHRAVGDVERIHAMSLRAALSTGGHGACVGLMREELSRQRLSTLGAFCGLLEMRARRKRIHFGQWLTGR